MGRTRGERMQQMAEELIAPLTADPAVRNEAVIIYTSLPGFEGGAVEAVQAARARVEAAGRFYFCASTQVAPEGL